MKIWICRISIFMVIFAMTTPVMANPARFDANTGAITIPALDIGGQCYRVMLDYYPNPSDSQNFYWIVDLNSVETTGLGCGIESATLNFGNLDILVPFLEHQGAFFEFTFNYASEISGGGNYIWKLDLSSFSPATAPFFLSSTAFSYGDTIPAAHTADGINVSPALSWQNPPAGTLSYVLIMDDPDAPMGTWDHWIVYDIPAATMSLAENAGESGGQSLPVGAVHGINSSFNDYYQGPGPPPGTGDHRYYFKLYALSVQNLNPTKGSKEDIISAMNGVILGVTELMGVYTRD